MILTVGGSILERCRVLTACIGELTQLKQDIPKLGLNAQRAQEVRQSVQSAVDAMNDHLTDDDIAGAMRDVAGDPVKEKGSGEPFDHLKEVTDAVNSLQSVRRDLNRVRTQLSSRQIDPKIVAEKLNPPLDAVKRTIKAVKNALAQVKKK